MADLSDNQKKTQIPPPKEGFSLGGQAPNQSFGAPAVSGSQTSDFWQSDQTKNLGTDTGLSKPGPNQNLSTSKFQLPPQDIQVVSRQSSVVRKIKSCLNNNRQPQLLNHLLPIPGRQLLQPKTPE